MVRPVCHRVDQLLRLLPLGQRAAEILDDGLGQKRLQILDADGLEQIVLRAGLHRALDVDEVVVAGDHAEHGRQPLLVQAGDKLIAVMPAEIDVHQRDVRLDVQRNVRRRLKGAGRVDRRDFEFFPIDQ